MAVSKWLSQAADAVDQLAEQYLPPIDGPAGHVGRACRHALAGGKRLRPMLVQLSVATWGGRAEDVAAAACAFELLHTATLIHDDLPAIDNADTRRGQPSVHVAFDEPTAILAGDALIVAAFQAMADQARASGPERALECLRCFAEAVQEVIAGEAADIVGEGVQPDGELLRFIHLHKTASLIRAACECGAVLAGAGEQGRGKMRQLGERLGLLFQITDDLLDVTGDPEVMGKPVGLDEAAGKQTYPRVYGLDGARRRAEELAAECRELAADLPRLAEVWLELVDLILERER